MTITALNEKWGIAGKIHFYEGNGGLTMIKINNEDAAATIALYGGQILSYIPKDEKDILWVSEQSLFESGKAIRGGIPVCFPWFGPHPSSKTMPQHGFARLQHWNVNDVRSDEKGSTLVSLLLNETPESLQLWPFPFTVTIDFIIGKTLRVNLTVANTGTQNFEYSDALHTYFNISDISLAGIDGLQKASYYNGFEMDLKVQDADILYFDGECNRRYINHTGNCIINDTGYKRKIYIAKTGSKVTVVWNPGESVTKTITDIKPEGYKTFVCVEPANAYAGIDMIQLSPGQRHSVSTTISSG